LVSLAIRLQVPGKEGERLEADQRPVEQGKVVEPWELGIDQLDAGPMQRLDHVPRLLDRHKRLRRTVHDQERSAQLVDERDRRRRQKR
jgi:hypothetical protein